MARELEVTRRTKKAIRSWAALPSTMGLILEDKLADLRPGHLNELRAKVNSEFSGERGMPIESDAADWRADKLETVENVRDVVRKRIEG
jgi:hypothetical protein